MSQQHRPIHSTAVRQVFTVHFIARSVVEWSKIAASVCLICGTRLALEVDDVLVNATNRRHARDEVRVVVRRSKMVPTHYLQTNA